MPLDKSMVYTTSKRKRPLILVTNDDGIDFKGIRLLAHALKKVGDVLVVAPKAEQSATSHALSLYKPLRCEKLSKNFYAVDGTPTDCINLAVHTILKGHKPDMIFSGINRGPNLGDDTHYSGTVSAAVEGGVFGIPSVAMSLGSTHDNRREVCTGKYKLGAAFAARLARSIIRRGLPEGVILNVNVPSFPKAKPKGYRITTLGQKNYADITTENIDPRGKRYFWIHGEEVGFDDIKGSDCNAVAEGFISITPLLVDITARSFIGKMRNWKI